MARRAWAVGRGAAAANLGCGAHQPREVVVLGEAVALQRDDVEVEAAEDRGGGGEDVPAPQK